MSNYFYLSDTVAGPYSERNIPAGAEVVVVTDWSQEHLNPVIARLVVRDEAGNITGEGPAFSVRRENLLRVKGPAPEEKAASEPIEPSVPVFDTSTPKAKETPKKKKKPEPPQTLF